MLVDYFLSDQNPTTDELRAVLEGLDIVTDEIKRIRQTYGPAAITGCTSSHHNYGLLFYKQGPFGRFFRMLDERRGSRTGPRSMALPEFTSDNALINSVVLQIAPATQSFLPLINLVML